MNHRSNRCVAVAAGLAGLLVAALAVAAIEAPPAPGTPKDFEPRRNNVRHADITHEIGGD